MPESWTTLLFSLSSFCIFTAATIIKTSATSDQQESIVDKPKEETVKAELSSALPCMTTKQDNKNNNVNPFAAGTAVWQNLMTYWLNAYGEFLKNAPKMTEQWYDIFWKPWFIWMPSHQRNKDWVMTAYVQQNRHRTKNYVKSNYTIQEYLFLQGVREDSDC